MSSQSYCIGDHVMYRQNGICRVDDIRTESFSGTESQYYVLQSVSDEHMKIYVPTKPGPLLERMRPLLTKEEIQAVITRSDEIDEAFLADGKARAEKFSEILHSGDSAGILWVVKILSLYKEKLAEEKRKFYASDKRVLAAAEKLIKEEFSFVLNIPDDEVIPYILAHLPKHKD